MAMTELVALMRNTNGYSLTLFKKQKTLLNKCIVCKQYMSSQKWSVILEEYVKQTLSIKSKKNNTSGDGYKNNINIEIKVSLGSKTGVLNYVQIRPDHDIHLYLLIGYDLFANILGKVHVIAIPSNKLYELIPTYGSYAHGTIKKLGRITRQNIKGRNCEYALRPNPQKRKENDKHYDLWTKLLECEIDFSVTQFDKVLDDLYK